MATATKATAAQRGPSPPRIPGIPDEIARRGDYLCRDEVLALLRIKPQTLYCYVSRGTIRRVRRADGRASFYMREDVERIRARSFARLGQGAPAARIIHWGEPVITTSITEIVREGPRYRDHLAVDLARRGTPFENVAEYLWAGQLARDQVLWKPLPAPSGLVGLLDAGARLHAGGHVLHLMSLIVSGLGMAEGTRRERIKSGSTPVQSARRMIGALTGAFGFLGPQRKFQPLSHGIPIAAALASMLGIKASDEQSRALNAALVLAADHELNPATFAARVAASASADIHSCIGAALHTHYGTLVGRACDRLEQLFRAGASAERIFEHARTMMEAGRMLPGFNHHLYPVGDPRAKMLIEIAVRCASNRSAIRQARAALNRLADELDLRPSIECALVVLVRALGLPDQTASGLYALGRTAGWTAHTLEQRLDGFVIRPRAKFVGKRT